MSYPTWPATLPPPTSVTDPLQDPKIKKQLGNGSMFVVPRFSRSYRTFELQWSSMRLADLDTLETFFDEMGGGLFWWQDPETGVGYVVFFDCDEVGRKRSGDRPGRAAVTVTMRQDPNAQ